MTKEKLFYRPAGWDNDKKIGILYENLTSMKPDDDYSDVIARPATRGAVKTVSSAGRDAAETHAEDEQSFLSRLLQQLQQQQPLPATMAGAVNGSVGVSTPANQASSPSPGSVTGTPIRSAQVQKPSDRRTSTSIPSQVNFLN